MKHLFALAGVIAILAMLVGCVGPEALYRATPVAKDTVWYSGSEFVTRTKDSVTVSVAFENELNGVMTYYVVIGNTRTAPVLVSPEQIHYDGECYRLREVEDPNTGYFSYEPESWKDTVYAIDPEKQLQGLDVQMAQTNATYATNSGLNAAAGLLQIVGDVATIEQHKTREQLHQERRSSRELEESQVNNNLNYSLQSASLADQRAYWQNAALRKTTLFSGNTVGGRVRIPLRKGTTKMYLVIPVGTSRFSFVFDVRPL